MTREELDGLSERIDIHEMQFPHPDTLVGGIRRPVLRALIAQARRAIELEERLRGPVDPDSEALRRRPDQEPR